MEFTVEQAFAFIAIALAFAVFWSQQQRIDKAIDALKDSAPPWMQETIETAINAAIDRGETVLSDLADATKTEIDDDMVDAIAKRMRELANDDSSIDEDAV